MLFNNENNPFTNYYLLIGGTNKKINNINNKWNNYFVRCAGNDNLFNSYFSKGFGDKLCSGPAISLIQSKQNNEVKKINCSCLENQENSKNSGNLEKQKELIKSMYKALFLYDYFLSGWKIKIIDNNNVKLLKKII
jgi:hypothetical protein